MFPALLSAFSVYLVVSLISGINCHVVLTYPPARQYALDFLDNIRTRPPCGMPKDNGPVTSFRTGSTVRVSWHIAYPHQGGYHLSLLDEHEKTIHNFTNTFVGQQDPTKLYHDITLPDEECRGCSIRIMRQAGEWGTSCAPGEYLFWSCADVDVTQVTTPACSSHGVLDSNGKCSCNGLYAGDKCQFKDECATASDCSGHGLCVDTQSTSYPKKQCYCDMGWFGRRCEKVSSVTSKSYEANLYEEANLSESNHYEVLYRVLQDTDELEVILKAETTTWLGIGWRPTDFRSGCQLFPNLIWPHPETTGEPEPESTSEPEPETSGKPEPEPEATAEPKPEPETTAEPEPEPEPDVCSWKSCSTENCEYHVKWEPNSDETVTFTIKTRLASQTRWTGIGFSSNKFMTTSDVIVAYIDSVGVTHVTDRWISSYSSSPTLDDDDGLTGITSKIEGPVTTFTFTRKLKSTDSQDYDFTSTQCPYFLFPVRGGNTTTGSTAITKHAATPEISADRICIKHCAKTTTEPEPEPSKEPSPEPEATAEPEPEPPVCNNEWKNCATDNCQYNLKWLYNEKDDTIKFTLKTRLVEAINRWTGIGFSRDRHMIGSDAVLAYIDVQGIGHVTDHWIASYVASPSEDSQQDVTNVTWNSSNGFTTFSFTRKRNTGDAGDFDFTGNVCPYFLFPEQGGMVENGDIFKHVVTPTISQSRICIQTCVQPNPEPTTEPEPNKPVSEPVKEPASEPTKEPVGEPAHEPEPGAEPTGEPEGEGEGGSCGTGPAGSSDTTGNSLHAMDCVDMVIGAAKGQRHRIADFYTRDRSTPLMDEMLGGQDSLTGALGFQENGRTTLIFRRKIQANERTDHTISEGNMHIIWALGQKTGHYSHTPNSGLEAHGLTPSDPDYYKQDELKYHGDRGSNRRGATSLNFHGAVRHSGSTVCSGGWGQCTDVDCAYHVVWQYNSDNTVTFTIKSDIQRDEWVGIGFSEDRNMGNSDAVIAWVTASGEVHISDRWITGYASPSLDEKRDLKSTSGSVVEGITTISFTRKLDTGDSADFSFDDEDGCAYFFYARGGNYNHQTKSITRHNVNPTRSQDKICIRKCADTTEGPLPGDKAGQGLTRNEKIIIGVVLAAVGLLLILGIVQCVRTKLFHSKEGNRYYKEDWSNQPGKATTLPPYIGATSVQEKRPLPIPQQTNKEVTQYPPQYNGNNSPQTKTMAPSPHPIEYNAWVHAVGNDSNPNPEKEYIELITPPSTQPQHKPEYLAVLPESQYVYPHPSVQNSANVRAPRYVYVNPGIRQYPNEQRVIINPRQNVQYYYQS